MPYTILFFLAFFVPIHWAAANNNSEKDRMYLHLDKGFYVSGERIHFSLFQSNKFLDQPIHLKIALLDVDGKTLNYQFIKTNGALRQSSFIDLPYRLPSDYYQFLVQVFDLPSRNVVTLGKVNLPIYNDFEAIPVNYKKALKSPPLNKEQLNIDIKIRNPYVAKRSKVEPKIQVKNKKGRFVDADISMSVKDVMANAGFENLFSFQVPYDCTYLGNIPFFEGKLMQKRFIVADDNIGLLPDHQFVELTKTCCGGQTIMTTKLDHLDSKMDLTQQYILFDSLIFIPQLFMTAHQPNPQDLVYNHVIIEYIKASRIRRKINLHFNTPPHKKAVNLIAKETPFFTPQLFWKSGHYSRSKTTTPNFHFQSDDRSTFQIEVVARDELGNIGRKKFVYSVH